MCVDLLVAQPGVLHRDAHPVHLTRHLRGELKLSKQLISSSCRGLSLREALAEAPAGRRLRCAPGAGASGGLRALGLAPPREPLLLSLHPKAREVHLHQQPLRPGT